ncbi:MAG: hypothetical protein NTY83_03605, partial [Candidatus Micrarchaeota archaeon]|nr:hypothetical protein [Candidatus Micrarchaeota archaeon]
MVDFGVARRQEPVPTNLAEARRMEWQTLPFSRISNDEGNTLVVLLPPSEHLAEEAQIAEYARQNPERAVILWLTPRGSERVSDSSPERGVSDLELVLRCLSNSTTFNEERNAVDKQSRIQDFATRLDEALGTGPFNPIENLDPMQALYNIYTYSKNDSRGFFAEVANETDQEAQQAMGNIL